MPQKPYTNGKLARDLGVLCLLVASLLLTFAYRQQVADMKNTIYTDCLKRQTYDMASNDLRDEMTIRFNAFAEQEKKNPYIDDTLRAKRVDAWQALARRADATVAAQVTGGCSDYR